jgi:hypothetical protein
LASGGPAKPIDLTPEFAAQELQNAGYDLDGLKGRPPQWLRALVQKKAPPKEILEVLGRRAVAGQSDPDEALMILNDLGRNTVNAEMITAMLTDDVIRQVSARAGGRF